jgi:predicted aspartyl protease
MGYTSVEVIAVDPKGEQNIKGLIVDTGAAYTTLSRDVLEAVGAFKLPTTLPLELGDGRIVEADVYALILRIGDRGGPIIASTFEGVKQVVGVQTLESLGLKVNPATGELEETRPKGITYFYQLNCYHIFCNER